MFRITYTPLCPRCNKFMKYLKTYTIVEFLKNPISGKERNYSVKYRQYKCNLCGEEMEERIVPWKKR
jgi:hypothetical protein